MYVAAHLRRARDRARAQPGRAQVQTSIERLERAVHEDFDRLDQKLSLLIQACACVPTELLFAHRTAMTHV